MTLDENWNYKKQILVRSHSLIRTINYIVDKHMVNGHIGYIINDPNEYVQLYAKDGNYLNDQLVF